MCGATIKIQFAGVTTYEVCQLLLNAKSEEEIAEIFEIYYDALVFNGMNDNQIINFFDEHTLDNKNIDNANFEIIENDGSIRIKIITKQYTSTLGKTDDAIIKPVIDNKTLELSVFGIAISVALLLTIIRAALQKKKTQVVIGDEIYNDSVIVGENNSVVEKKRENKQNIGYKYQNPNQQSLSLKNRK